MSHEIFDTSFLLNDRTRRARHGQIWTKEELTQLDELYLAGQSLRQMAIILERPEEGVISKLEARRHIVFIPSTGEYAHVTPPTQTQPTTAEEITMEKNAPIETKTFIFGADAANMSDAQIFTQIGKIEREIATLDQIQHKPKKLSARIEELRADVVKLADYVDAR